MVPLGYQRARRNSRPKGRCAAAQPPSTTQELPNLGEGSAGRGGRDPKDIRAFPNSVLEKSRFETTRHSSPKAPDTGGRRESQSVPRFRRPQCHRDRRRPPANGPAGHAGGLVVPMMDASDASGLRNARGACNRETANIFCLTASSAEKAASTDTISVLISSPCLPRARRSCDHDGGTALTGTVSVLAPSPKRSKSVDEHIVSKRSWTKVQ